MSPKLFKKKINMHKITNLMLREFVYSEPSVGELFRKCVICLAGCIVTLLTITKSALVWLFAEPCIGYIILNLWGSLRLSAHTSDQRFLCVHDNVHKNLPFIAVSFEVYIGLAIQHYKFAIELKLPIIHEISLVRSRGMVNACQILSIHCLKRYSVQSHVWKGLS